MEHSKSDALMDDWRNYLRNGKGDIFEIIDKAIMVAASDRPTEFQTERHKIAQCLFSDESMINCCSENKVDVDRGDIERVHMSQGVAEVLRMKKILEKSNGDESVVCDLLMKLESMALTMKTLEATMIGKTVSALKKQHASEKVRGIAATLVKAWKRTAVDDWRKKQSNINVVEPTLKSTQQVKPPMNVTMNTERSLEGSEKSSKIGVMDMSSEKLEATKRKLQQGYEENLKKRRKIQVMDLCDVMKQGLLVPRIDLNRRKVYGRSRC